MDLVELQTSRLLLPDHPKSFCLSVGWSLKHVLTEMFHFQDFSGPNFRNGSTYPHRHSQEISMIAFTYVLYSFSHSCLVFTTVTNYIFICGLWKVDHVLPRAHAHFQLLHNPVIAQVIASCANNIVSRTFLDTSYSFGRARSSSLWALSSLNLSVVAIMLNCVKVWKYFFSNAVDRRSWSVLCIGTERTVSCDISRNLFSAYK